jgi:hypothetical protein
MSGLISGGEEETLKGHLQHIDNTVEIIIHGLSGNEYIEPAPFFGREMDLPIIKTENIDES